MKGFRIWTRDWHLYGGLFLSPFILIFAVSTILLNHKWPQGRQPAGELKQSVTIDGQIEVGSLKQAKDILRQLQISGEIEFLRHQVKESKLVIPVSKPGLRHEVEVDLLSGQAAVQTHRESFGSALIYLHRMPGPHNVKLRGNWIYTVWWGALADVTVAGVIFLTASGLFLWWWLKAERNLGWAFLAAGAFSFLALVVGVCFF